MIKLLIFDLDGTLVDSSHDIVNAANEFLKNHGKQPRKREEVIARIGDGPGPLLKGIMPELDDTQLPLAEKEYAELYQKHLLNNTQLMPGALAFLQSWDGKLAIVSNKISALVNKTINGLPLKDFNWLCALGVDSLPARKPDPLPLLEAIKIAEVLPTETVMIGDGIPDIKAAKAAGVRSVAITFGLTAKDDLLALKPDVALYSYSDLRNILDRM